MSPSIDRLSGLPDEVIFHILSFLPTKTSASTNVLAKRWRFLWAHVPNLDFYDHDFKGETQDSDVIHRVIVLHRAITMNTFHLSLVKCSEYQLATWITHAVNRGFRNLFLDLKNTCNDDPATFTLPRCLFTCKTLVEAEIRCVRWITLSGKVFWPSLKKLNLTSIMFEDDRCLPHLLSGCPVLEELTVELCEIEMEPINYDSGLVFISSPTIKILNVNLDYGCHKFKINAPSVVCLNVINCCLEDITSLTTMTSLIEAHISLIGDWDEDVRVINNTEHATTRFLNSLCNVKCLKFSVRNGEILGKGVSIAGLETLVKFDKLTKLEFNLVFDFDEIAKFLQVADNLQVLIITLCGMHNTFREPKQVPTCMLSRLKTVQITLFDDFSEHDFEMISYLKRKAQVLERIKIHSYSHLFSKNKIPFLRIRLTMIPSGSKSCQLVLS